MGEKLYHIGLSEEDVKGARYAIIAGDPGRIPLIGGKMDNAVQIGQNREYTSWLGQVGGKYVVAMSHGIGGPSTAIGVEELHMLGVDTFIRVGTSGGMDIDVMAGDVVIVNGAIRAEGTSREYLPIEFPAVADLDVTYALREAARALGYRHHVGVAQCKDSYYGQHDPERMPVSYDLLNKWQAWLKGGALVSEMETAALYTVCSTLRARGGGIMNVVWNQEREAAGLSQEKEHNTEKGIEVALKAIEMLDN